MKKGIVDKFISKLERLNNINKIKRENKMLNKEIEYLIERIDFETKNKEKAEERNIKLIQEMNRMKEGEINELHK